MKGSGDQQDFHYFRDLSSAFQSVPMAAFMMVMHTQLQRVLQEQFSLVAKGLHKAHNAIPVFAVYFASSDMSLEQQQECAGRCLEL